MRYPKFGILEIDNVELPGLAEYEPVSEDIYYDLGKLTTVKDRIDLSAMGYSDFFQNSLDRNLTIPLGRSKIVSKFICINEFKLKVEGTLEIS